MGKFLGQSSSFHSKGVTGTMMTSPDGSSDAGVAIDVAVEHLVRQTTRRI